MKLEKFDLGKFEVKNQFLEASAGTGKTYSIVEIVKKLLNHEEDGRKPYSLDNILIVTYTGKAVGELKSRIYGISGGNAQIYTIHSFCKEMMSAYPIESGRPVEVEVIDEKKLLKEYIDGLVRDEFCRNEAFVSLMKNAEGDGAAFLKNFSHTVADGVEKYYLDDDCEECPEVVSMDKGNCVEQTFLIQAVKDVYLKWQEEKRRRRLVTFNDMLKFCREAVMKKGLAEQLRKRYKVAIIDEFQDTNQKEWDIFRTVFDKALIVVGDPKQSIYSFQGADVNVYHNATKSLKIGYVLPENYRSTTDMIELCNKIFGSDFFTGKDQPEFFPSAAPKKKKRPAEYDGQPARPLWLACSVGKIGDFARLAAKKIIDCCMEVNGHTRLQVFDENDESKLRDVSFGDFVVLASKRTHMQEMERELRIAGIPYSRYMDDNLFDGAELKNWLSLLKALDVRDFSADNRKILNECLSSKFFEFDLGSLYDVDVCSDTKCREAKLLAEWRRLASLRQWAMLFENIYEQSGIEGRLCEEDDLQSLGKYRQIGDYILEYLYTNNCNISDVIYSIEHDEIIGNDKDDAIVAKSTDADCVKIMTIHASKGLQFQVVISVSPCDCSNAKSGFCLYHRDGNMFLGFDYDQYNEEKMAEQQRLFYVCYTRAKSLLLLPQYPSDKDAFSGKAIASVVTCDGISGRLVRKIVDDGVKRDKPNRKTACTLTEEQCKSCLRRIDSLRVKPIEARSYSSLSSVANKELFDERCIQLQCTYDRKKLRKYSASLPGGIKMGNAVHKILELVDFRTACCRNRNDFVSSVSKLVEKCFADEGVPVRDDTVCNTARMVFDTLNARLPMISGGDFCLHDICREDRVSEGGFGFGACESGWNGSCFSGAVDLLFRHESDGKTLYCIVDWKTDSFDEEGDYADPRILKAHTDSHYSIQRVLYAYCFMRYLHGFYPDVDMESIFARYFGGFYYIYTKGCSAGTGNGVYAQSWSCWQDIYDEYCMIRSIGSACSDDEMDGGI